jgi:O-methyltransferase
MNSSEPERKALEHFYPKMLSGGIIYFDDYGWGYPELRKVVDEFFSNKPEKLIHFPSGNSIIVKA